MDRLTLTTPEYTYGIWRWYAAGPILWIAGVSPWLMFAGPVVAVLASLVISPSSIVD